MKNDRLNLRIEEGFKKDLENAAKAEGKTLNSYIESVLMAEVEKNKLANLAKEKHESKIEKDRDDALKYINSMIPKLIELCEKMYGEEGNIVDGGTLKNGIVNLFEIGIEKETFISSSEGTKHVDACKIEKPYDDLHFRYREYTSKNDVGFVIGHWAYGNKKLEDISGSQFWMYVSRIRKWIELLIEIDITGDIPKSQRTIYNKGVVANG